MTKPANPLAVEVVRGPLVESRHRVAAAVADARGPLAAWGDVEAVVLPRSAVKPLQVLPLIETGAAEASGVSESEIALACSSHNGESCHVAAVTAWLERLGLAPDDLECGAHAPLRGAPPARLTPAHNNCSGKHTAMLATARHLGEPLAGYVAPDHPVQRRLRTLLGELAGHDLSTAPSAIDGCSIPTIAMPLTSLALAFARFATGDVPQPERKSALARVRRAMATHPFMVAGTGRFCTALIEATAGHVLVKTGAEGVMVAAVPEAGLGLALKVDDGASRAAEVAMVALLRHLDVLTGPLAPAVAAFAAPPQQNWRGLEIGVIRTAAGWPE